MLPAQYQLPAAIVLVLAGVVACFFGYRLFRIVLSIFGFVWWINQVVARKLQKRIDEIDALTGRTE